MRTKKNGQHVRACQPKQFSLEIKSTEAYHATRKKIPRLPTIGEYFKHLHIKLIRRAEWLRAEACPFCGSPKTFLIRLPYRRFLCLSCDANGNGLPELHAQLHGITHGVAIRELIGIAGRIERD